MADTSLKLYAIGQRGVDVVNKPQDLDESELINAQNVEILAAGGRGALDQRPGMSRINSAALGGSVLMALDVPSPLLSDYTAYLYAGLNGAATHKWRRTSDGVTWTNDDTPAKPFNPLGTLANFKNWPKAVTIGTKMYYLDGNSPIGLHQFDGVNDITLSTIPPSVASLALTTPGAPNIGAAGVQQATTYSYVAVAKTGPTHSKASAVGSVVFGNATLSTSNYNEIVSFGAADPPVAGATSYDVYRTVGGATQGLIGSVPIVAGAFTHGNGSGGANPDNAIFLDKGLTGDASTAPSTVSGTGSANAIAVIDLITDGSSLYLAVIDAVPGDPTVNGRLLQFNPISGAWTQIGLAFPTASGNGAPGTLCFYQGALTYGTYIGTTAANTAYFNSTGTPLPAGGPPALTTLTASFEPISCAVLNGVLYFGLSSLAAVAAQVIRYTEAVPAGTTSLIAGGSVAQNSFTSMAVFNGRLYVGWWSGTATASVISSTADGVTWATELSLNNNEFPAQMVTFSGALFVVTNTTGSGGSRILKRTAGGVWSTADDPSDNFAGCLAVVYV